LVEAKSFGVDGYLTGAMGLTDNRRDYIYIWFSSGEICVDESSQTDDGIIKDLFTTSLEPPSRSPARTGAG
jgi:hypothetical protein